jgi:DeoR/GlpR family transcriptional regulator of sugar metabolism
MQGDTRDARHRLILAELHALGAVTVAKLSAALGVSDITIRRDLEYLEKQTVLKRFHGGAKLAAGNSYEPPVLVRIQRDVAAKRRIATAVSELVKDGDTIILDGGSTGMAIAGALMNRPITVCPLSMQIAWQLGKSPMTDVLMPPGLVRKVELTLSGAETVEYLSAHNFDLYIMTASGFSVQRGFTAWNLEDTGVKRAAHATAVHTIAAVAASKFGTNYFAPICSIDAPDTIVTTVLVGDLLTQLREASRSLLLA